MRFRRAWLAGAAAVAMLLLGAACDPGTSFVNFENQPVHGLEMTPGGSKLLAVNTADGRLEVFDLSGGAPVKSASIPVGLDPVSVRALDDGTAWVVNHVSDSVSVVDLATANVVATLATGDEPADVVFAGTPRRAFVSISQGNAIEVHDPANLAAAPVVVPIEGEEPRALATDGTRVYAALFESGNATTIVKKADVADPTGPYGGQNPPPNAGTGFDPPMAPGLPTPPTVSLIVRKSAGRWLDVNGGDWSALVPWDLLDHDVAILPVANPTQVSYVTGLMNMDMALATTHTGRVAVVGTEAVNEVRFEPNVKANFVRVVMASFEANGSNMAIADLNPHLDYGVRNVPQAVRDQSLADPRAVVWSSTQNRGWVSGLGSGNVIAIDATGARLGRVHVGLGLTSLSLDEARNRLYVLDRFEGSVSVVDPTAMTQLGKISFFDPTPAVIETGRPMLYDAHRTSGLGQAACASCHVDGRTDPLAWDLGDPSGAMKPFNQTCMEGEECRDWHPMKGPMTTQTLLGIVGTEPLHWRGDREDLAAFAGAFVGLMGDDDAPTATEMQQFEDFVATLRFPPNPFRNLDGGVKNEILPNGGNPLSGQAFFRSTAIDAGRLCSTCHVEPLGTTFEVAARNVLPGGQNMKVPSIRATYEKTGLSFTSLRNTRGFGVAHDGAADSVVSFLDTPPFQFPPGELGLQQRKNLEAFVFSFTTDTPAAVGQQLTVNAANKAAPATLARLDALLGVADTNVSGAVVKGRLAGLQRGGYYLGNDVFQLDRASETLTVAQMLAAVAAGQEVTVTLVPYESRKRIGADRDSDGLSDRDELDVGRDPADPAG